MNRIIYALLISAAVSAPALAQDQEGGGGYNMRQASDDSKDLNDTVNNLNNTVQTLRGGGSSQGDSSQGGGGVMNSITNVFGAFGGNQAQAQAAPNVVQEQNPYPVGDMRRADWERMHMQREQAMMRHEEHREMEHERMERARMEHDRTMHRDQRQAWQQPNRNGLPWGQHQGGNPSQANNNHNSLWHGPAGTPMAHNNAQQPNFFQRMGNSMRAQNTPPHFGTPNMQTRNQPKLFGNNNNR